MGVFTDIGNQTDPIKKKQGIPTVSKGVDLGVPNTGIKPLDTAALSRQPSVADISSGFNFNFTGNKGVDAGFGVASLLPQAIQQWNIDPGSGQSEEEVRGLQKARTIGLATSGAQIGGTIGNAVGGPIGGLIGGFVGGGAGYAFGDSQRGKGLAELRARENEASQKEWDEEREKNIQSYLDINSSERIKKEMDLISQSQGYIT